MTTPIDFKSIRGETPEGQRSAFEQLICHLARLDGAGGVFRRIEGAGGDGGVEALRILATGRKVGYQAKYHPERCSIDWRKVEASVITALDQHPELERYVIAIPCDFTGKRAARGGVTEGVWGEWDRRVTQWSALAAARQISVQFEPWTAFEIESALLRPDAEHLVKPFFDRLAFSTNWMNRHFKRTIDDLQARYSPGEHVDTEALMPFDVIFRRENVKSDLREVFDLASLSNPRAAAALIETGLIPDAVVAIVEDLRARFVTLGSALDWDIGKEWPCCDWMTAWHYFARGLFDIHDRISDALTKDKIDYQTVADRVEGLTKTCALRGPEVFGGRWVRLIAIDVARALLVVGRAGSGKSHVLAHASQSALDAEAPVIHILGQHILDTNPRAAILKHLELSGWSFDEMLTALNLAAERARTRALLVIDALNEGHGIDIWRNHLSSLINEVNGYERIVLVVSCRDEYLDYVVPSDLIAEPHPYPTQDGRAPRDCAPVGKFIRQSVAGFRTEDEREAALRMFMDAKKIARPTAPVLDDEFFNPLFMSSVCRSMAQAGIKEFPRGLRGARQVFDFVLETKTKAFGTRHDGASRLSAALKRAFADLAGHMVENRCDHVPLDNAQDLIARNFISFPINGQTWLDVLAGSDLLRVDVEGGTGWYPNEVLRFSFQRLQDQLMAEHLVALCPDIEQAFLPNGPLAFLVTRCEDRDGHALLELRAAWIGTLGALWAAVAEVHGKELWDLPSFFGSPAIRFHADNFRPAFLASIRERSVAAFTERTRDIMKRLWHDRPQDRIEIRLSVACVPGHPWNADDLASRFLAVPLAERDSIWSRHFIDDSSSAVSKADEIIQWALNVGMGHTGTEVARLAATTFVCLFSITNRRIRDRATKALVTILLGAHELFPGLIQRFGGVDDPYVLERLLAAGFGAICIDASKDRIGGAAQSVAQTIFSEESLPVHLAVRDLACAILERAAERGLLPPGFDLSRARPPFASEPPRLDLDRSAVDAAAVTAGDDGIANSCGEHGDFGIYEIPHYITNFSDTSLSDPAPLTIEEQAKRFADEIQREGPLPTARLQTLMAAGEIVGSDVRASMRVSSKGLSPTLDEPVTSSPSVQALSMAEKSFLECLPPSLRNRYPEELAPQIHGEHKPPQSLDVRSARLWISLRAYELGWTKERFPNEPYRGDRNRPDIERIGKKYQWIALGELMARLADNFWLNAEYELPTRAYRSKRDLRYTERFDPTVLGPVEPPDREAEIAHGPPALVLGDVDGSALAAWPFVEDHFETPRPWLIASMDGKEWLIADWVEAVDERVDEHMHGGMPDPFRRQIQAFVSLVAYRPGDRLEIVDEFLTSHDRGMMGWGLSARVDGYFAREVIHAEMDEIPFWTCAGRGDVEIASPFVSGLVETGSDRSLASSVNYLVPHPRIGRALGLHLPDPRDMRHWYLPDNELFLSKTDGRGSPLLVNKERFDKWCRSEGLEYAWIYIGERTAWLGARSMRIRRTKGVAWFEGQELRHRNKTHDR